MRALGAGLVVLAMSSQAGQQPARDQPAQRPGFGTGAVAGRVVNGETRQPIADALVALIGGQTTTIRVGQTDAKGTFILPAVPAGKFVLSASKAPYLGSMYGAPKPARPGTALVLTEGQIVSGLEILMWPGAVVTGTVTDQDGEPVADAEVQLQRAATRGNQMLQMVAALGGAPRATTDDRGIYRIFGVAPGDYLVMATVPDTLARARRLGTTEVADGLLALREPPRATGRGAAGAASAPAPPLPIDGVRFGPGVPPGFSGFSSYAPVYFPGTTDMSRATTISVALGEERTGVSLRLEIVPLVRVEGTVFGADGVGAANVQITLQRLDETSFMAMLRSGIRSAQTAANGQFTVRNVAPGQYRVLARSARTQQAASTFWGSADVTIGGQDVGGLVLQMQPALSITGRVAIDDTATTARPELTTVRAGFVPMDVLRDQIGAFAGMVAGAGGQAARADGSFEAGGLIPGAHLTSAMVGAENPLSFLTWRVGAVVIDGRDVTDLPFDVKADALPKSVLVTLTDKQQTLSGVIADSSGRPLTASTVLMFATDRRYWYPQSRRVLAVRPSTDGSYEFSGLLGPSAGEYFLSVVTDLEPEQQYDPTFLEALAKAAPLRILLGPGEVKRQDLKVR
jgi:sarcosine oxidase gamma subunit